MIAGLVLLGGGVAAGAFGSLLGLGGGILIVPLLTLGFGVPLREAVAVSLVSVIVTSSASAAVYLQRHVANLRLGMTLELFSATGALVGGLVAFMINEQVLAGLFAVLLVWVAASMARRKDPPGHPSTPARRRWPRPLTPARRRWPAPGAGDAGSRRPGAGPGRGARRRDRHGALVHDLALGSRLRGAPAPGRHAGVRVRGRQLRLARGGRRDHQGPVMNLVMGVPLRTSTATSNMMMGITATASAVIYLLRDEIDPFIAGPIALGVFVGASVGSRVAHRIDVRILRWLFVVVLLYTAIQMATRALGL